MKNSIPISSESGIYHYVMHIDNLHKTMNIYKSVVTLKFFNNTTHEIRNSTTIPLIQIASDTKYYYMNCFWWIHLFVLFALLQ